MTPSLKRSLQIGAITLVCVGGYFGLRSMPVESCEFLHYGDYVSEEGVIEGCGYEETIFFDLEELRFPVRVRIEPLETAVAGQPVSFLLSMETSTGRPIRAEDLAIAHTERLHAMIIDPERADYHHLHPEPAGAPGTFVFSLTPSEAGTYKVFLDFISLISNRRMLVGGSFEVGGPTADPGADSGGAPAGPVAMTRLETEADGIRYRLVPDEGGFAVGAKKRFHLEVETIDGSALEFTPVMDSYAHIVAFDQARRGFAHFHPVNIDIRGQDPAAPDLEFVFQLDQPGHYRVWAQLHVNGRERFVPFDLTL